MPVFNLSSFFDTEIHRDPMQCCKLPVNGTTRLLALLSVVVGPLLACDLDSNDGQSTYQQESPNAALHVGETESTQVTPPSADGNVGRKSTPTDTVRAGIDRSRAPSAKSVSVVKPKRRATRGIGAPKRTPQQRRSDVRKRFSRLLSSRSAVGGLLRANEHGSRLNSLADRIGASDPGPANAQSTGLGVLSGNSVGGNSDRTSLAITKVETVGRFGEGRLTYGSDVVFEGSESRSIMNLSRQRGEGSLPAAAIERSVSQNKDQVRYCYEAALRRNLNVEGRVRLMWFVTETGDVEDVAVKDSVLKDADVEQCLIDRIAGWRFPKPRGGSAVKVEYSFVFNAR